eukprot:CAMPEP_0185769196 /NCGR_PEP_ID=MMETSP1174-20130828/53432_1 /TAXON_ID=35687 /ORGANISM="Dictyocha speculum, Strain CCMP1381" /LENGTH=391 /DNA_ID=CAMNT_0028454171 /DNA_START=63 /DNA_END=1238 /DNA_ORIENTATION=+
MIKAGVMREPVWLKVLKRSPPPPLLLNSKKRIPNIVLPTDRLYKIRSRTHASTEPFFAHGQIQSAGFLFANRQWELMQTKNISEKEAYRMVEEQLVNMKAVSLDQLKGLTSSLKEEGASTALLSDPAVAKQFSEWQMRLEEISWDDWELGQQVMLDHWICKAVLKWDWEKERYLRDATFEVELALLRHELFPSIPIPEDENDEAHDIGCEEDEDPESFDAHEEDAINTWYSTYGSWQTKAYNQPDLTKWTEQDKHALDRWILENCLSNTLTSKVDPMEVLDKLEEARDRLFPPFRSDDGDYSNLDEPHGSPDVAEVKKMIAGLAQSPKLAKAQISQINEWERSDQEAIARAYEDEKWDKRELAREKILFADRRARAKEEQRALDDWIKNEM